MSTVNQPLRIEDLQLKAKGPSRVVTIKPGQEAEAARISARSGADLVPFNLGGDQMVLAGRGLKLEGVYKGTPVSFGGKTGAVTDDVISTPNTFAEGFSLSAPRGAVVYGLAGAALGFFGAGIEAIMNPFSWATVLKPIGFGVALGLGIAALGALGAAAKRVDLKSFSKVQK